MWRRTLAIARIILPGLDYKQFRNRIVNEIRESRKNYYHKYFDEHKNNMKMFLKGIKGIICIRPVSIETISYLKDKDGIKISFKHLSPVILRFSLMNLLSQEPFLISLKLPRKYQSSRKDLPQ